jgi:hypothetical protein
MYNQGANFGFEIHPVTQRFIIIQKYRFSNIFGLSNPSSFFGLSFFL